MPLRWIIVKGRQAFEGDAWMIDALRQTGRILMGRARRRGRLREGPTSNGPASRFGAAGSFLARSGRHATRSIRPNRVASSARQWCAPRLPVPPCASREKENPTAAEKDPTAPMALEMAFEFSDRAKKLHEQALAFAREHGSPR